MGKGMDPPYIFVSGTGEGWHNVFKKSDIFKGTILPD
jgi:hypothetical protein